MRWGVGDMTEEATYHGCYHEPSIQLMQFKDGSHASRFCYDAGGRFQRSPLAEQGGVVGGAECAPSRPTVIARRRLAKNNLW
jgi:hypothetical protein